MGELLGRPDSASSAARCSITTARGPALTSGRNLRVRDAAANAVMAGCAPHSFPVVLAALRAMAKPDYRLSQAAIARRCAYRHRRRGGAAVHGSPAMGIFAGPMAGVVRRVPRPN
jgi:hypothetical protein